MLAFTSDEQLSTQLIEAEKEKEIKTTMYIEMFYVAESELSQVHFELTQVEKPTLPKTGHDSNGSERTLSDEEGEDEEAQQ